METDEDRVRESLFGPNPRAFALIAEWNGAAAGFAVWFYNYSTFLGRHGIFLEDLFVYPELRGKGIGKALLATLARRCVQEGLPPPGMGGARLERALHRLLPLARRHREGRMDDILPDRRRAHGDGVAGRMSAPAIVIVVAVAENGVIGARGGLPWRIRADLRRFRAVTMGKPLVMGRKTFESIGRVLDGRDNIVVTRRTDFAPAGRDRGGQRRGGARHRRGPGRRARGRQKSASAAAATSSRRLCRLRSAFT